MGMSIISVGVFVPCNNLVPFYKYRIFSQIFSIFYLNLLIRIHLKTYKLNLSSNKCKF